VLGALCVADGEPREWSSADVEALEGLAAAAAAEVALRRERADRRRAEAALAHERGFGLQVMSALGQGISVLDAEGRVEYANPAFLRMLGAESDDLVGHAFWDFALPPDREEVASVHRLALAGERQGREVRMCRLDGAVLHSYVAGAPRADGTGAAVGTLLTVSNVSGRRQAEQALSEAEERFRRLSEASEEGIVIHDQGLIVDANLAASQLLGYDTEPPLKGHHLLDVVAPESHEVASRHLDDAGRGSYEAVLLRRDGTHVPVRLRGRPIQFHGRTARVVTIRDLSEQHVMERLKDEFVSMVSHELRTPLTSLRGSLGLLSSGKLNAHQAQRMLEVAVQNTDRLVRLINDILDVERIESGQVAMDVRSVPAAEVLRQAAESVRGLAEKAGTRIELAGGGIPVLADPDRIVQVMVNLLSNAIKFSPGGSLVRATVEVRAGEAVFRVVDQGRGIPEDKLGLIFERFQQVDASDSRKLGGTGLGLAICRSIIQQHRGRIWVDSEFGSGSTFFFTLPIPRPADD
ncbi:MAG TPA: PAS domain S-box protein, partial [Longimicrobium sp.]|nr:PAS domain S-box protein [Longimicrobium sp.]